MLDLKNLEQFVTFADHGTLSGAAESLHVSQPTLTRTMRQVEEQFELPLFERGKNRISLNETGKYAAECARKLLEEADRTKQMVQTFDKKAHTIHVESCAPAPLWELLPDLSSRYCENTISSRLSDIENVIQSVIDGRSQVGIIPYACPQDRMEQENLVDASYVREKLSVCVPKGHELEKYDELKAEQLNGYNCLLRDQIGFWTGFCYEKMPASRFLIQTDEFDFQELIRTSSLLCFTTNLAATMDEVLDNRKITPLTDSEADVTYHLICQKKNIEFLRPYM